jgi:hypothetical protein
MQRFILSGHCQMQKSEVIEKSMTGGKRQALRSAFVVCKKYAAKTEDPSRTELFEDRR